jgi:predicted nucleic acid-binding protein
MSKIVIDTNVYLDFYRSNNESLKKLEELKKYSEYILFPEQVYNEYNRNRNTQFDFLKQEFSKYKNALKPFNSNYIKSFSEYKELIDLNRQTKEQIDKLLRKIENVKNETENDEIYKVVSELYRMDEVKKLPINRDIIERSKNRQMLGNPPGTGNVTIGDEVIWESILSHANEDIVIVSNDLSFLNNKRFLEVEYQQKCGFRLLDITKKITDAIIIIGASPSKQLEELEDETAKIKAEIKAKSSFKADGVVVQHENYRYGGSVPNSGIFCPVCGSNGPFNGVMCMNCGSMDDD